MRRLVLLSLLGCAAIMPVIILPSLVDALVTSAALSERMAGWAAGIGTLGSALAAIVIAFHVHRIELRRLGRYGLLIMCAGSVVSCFVQYLPLPLFLAARFVASIGGGMAYAAVMSTIAAELEPDRGYGVFIVFQFAMSGVGLYLLPQWAPYLGITGIYAGIAALDIIALPVTFLLVRREGAPHEAAPKLERDIVLSAPALCATLGIGLFEAANMAEFTYADRIGLAFGLTPHQIGTVLGIASFVGIPGAAAVVWIGERYGRFAPVAAICGIEAVAFYLLMHGSGYNTYFACMCVIAAGWAFGLPYIQSIEAGLDIQGSVVVLGGFFAALGDSLGPSAAATVVKPGQYGHVLIVSMVMMFIVVTLLRTSLAVRSANA